MAKSRSTRRTASGGQSRAASAETAPSNPHKKGTAPWIAWDAQARDEEYQADRQRRAEQGADDAAAEHERNLRAPWNNSPTVTEDDPDDDAGLVPPDTNPSAAE